MAFDFQGKVVLVTGASRGIGREIALGFGRGGATVAVNDIPSQAEHAREACARIEQVGGKAFPIEFDVANPAACTEAVEKIAKEQGGLHVLVHNAGIARDALIIRMKDEDLEKTLDVNLKAAFYLARATAKVMMKQREGSMVMLSSVVGEMGNAGQAVYSATKAGLIGLTKSLARELAGRNVRVNAVGPGFIDTVMTQGIPEENRRRMLEQIPLGRMGSAEEIANAVCFLASPYASYITGEVLRVNGGMYT
jgi:3-oxoacyl-[acyl-carrier protein] reductase